MRRTVAFAAAVLLVGVAAAGAPGGTARSDVRGVCNTQGIDVFFWPQGHQAIPVLGFPAFGVPHVEFHKARDHTNSGALAYMDLSQNGLNGAHCSGIGDTAMPFGAGAPTQTASSAQKIRCTLGGNADVRIAPWTRTVRRVVFRTVRVRGKKKRVRRTIRSTQQAGVLATIGAAGTTGAVADIRLSRITGVASSMKWDTRSCAAVDVAG
jgi:hypothetical protein